MLLLNFYPWLQLCGSTCHDEVAESVENCNCCVRFLHSNALKGLNWQKFGTGPASRSDSTMGVLFSNLELIIPGPFCQVRRNSKNMKKNEQKERDESPTNGGKGDFTKFVKAYSNPPRDIVRIQR